MDRFVENVRRALRGVGLVRAASVIAALALVAVIACSPSIRFGKTSKGGGSTSTPRTVTESETGIASYYADKFHGKRTANGETFDMHALTAAHPSLPFNTIIDVTNLANDKRVRLRVNDRFPGTAGRVIDVSLEAAKRLGMIQSGTARVRIDVIKRGG
jgi:rare lipoprotein A